ncbi:MAG: DUF559 domain-containing protein [Nanoarchaeota archaeon]
MTKGGWNKGLTKYENPILMKMSLINQGKHRSPSTEFKKGLIPWNKGKTGVYSESTIKKISEGNKGKIVTEETKRKMSLASKGRKMSDEFKIKLRLANLGKKLSEEHKNKLKLAHLDKKFSEEHKLKIKEGLKKWSQKIGPRPNHVREAIRKKLIGHEVSIETRKKIAESQTIRLNNNPEKHPNYICSKKGKNNLTYIEMIMLKILEKTGLKYNKDLFHNNYIKVYNGFYYPDFFIPSKNLIIECDGKYWHNKQRDEIRQKNLELAGYKVIRFSGKEIKFKSEEVKNKLLDFLKT